MTAAILGGAALLLRWRWLTLAVTAGPAIVRSDQTLSPELASVLD